MVISSTNKHLPNSSKIYFENSSVNLSSSINLYIISDTEVTDLSCVINNTENFQLFKIIDGEVIIVDYIDNANVEVIQTSGKWVYKINIVFTSTNADSYNGKINVIYNSNNLTFELIAVSEEINEALLVSLQNLKQYISEDYVTAFRESVVNSSEIDVELYNRKMREMLHNIFELTALSSSYKNLLTILSFFGYGDLLSIKEYWSSNDQYKSTDIANSVLTVIDKHLAGFSKSNQMSLVYQINEESGIDADGLPIYTNVFDDTDNILTKLYALKRVLTKDFLYINTHIVDIVGEFQTVVGLELNAILNSVTIEDIKLTDNLNSPVAFEFLNKTVYIERHDVLLEPYSLQQISTDEIGYIPGLITSTQSDTLFHIKKLATDFEEFDLLTTFYSGDFGMIELSLDLDKTRYQLFKYTIQNIETQAIEFMSKSYSLAELSDNILRCGIKNLGQYKITLFIIDWYGAATIVGINDPIVITTRPIDIFIGKYDLSGTVEKDLVLYTTFKDTTGETDNIVVDNLSESFDTNTWDPFTNTPAMLIARMYESDFDQFSTYTNLNQLNSIPISQLDNLPLNTWGHKYGIGIVDILGDLSSGDKTFGLRIFNHLEYDYLSQYYDGIENQTIWLTRFVATLNSLNVPNSTFNDFTFDVHCYSNNPIIMIDDIRPMLRLKSKQSGYSMNMLDIVVDHTAHDDFVESFEFNDMNIFSRVDANLQFTVVNTSTSSLTIVINNEIFISENVEIISNTDVVTAILALIPEQYALNVYVTEANNSIMIFSKHDFSITHDSINGTHYDIARGLDSSKIKKLDLGSDIKLGEPVFAFIDLEKRIDLGDTTWILRNTLTNEIVTTQHAWSFRWILSAIGSYSLTLTCTDKSGLVTTTKHGCIVVS